MSIYLRIWIFFYYLCTLKYKWTMEDKFAIQLFEGNKVCVVWDEEQEKYFFSVVDIIQVLTDSVDAKQYIKRLRSRDPELNLRWGYNLYPY